jgi:hypothetical protein
MHLERNLNPTLSRIYIASGLVMLAAAVAFLLLPLPRISSMRGLVATVLIVSGALSILSGALHH